MMVLFLLSLFYSPGLSSTFRFQTHESFFGNRRRGLSTHLISLKVEYVGKVGFGVFRFDNYKFCLSKLYGRLIGIQNLLMRVLFHLFTIYDLP